LEIANEFNEFFIKAGDFDRSLLDLAPVPSPSREMMMSYVGALKARSYSPDGIPATAIKILAEINPNAILKYINSSLLSANFPDNVKSGVLKPVFKKRCRDKIENYRPITLSSHLSKLLEKPVKTQISEFLLDSEFLYSHHTLYDIYRHLRCCYEGSGCYSEILG